MSKGTFTITCYNHKETYKESDRKKQTKAFEIAMRCCEGSERDRYAQVYFDLLDGKKDCRDDYWDM